MIAKPQMWWPGTVRQHPLTVGAVATWPLWEGAGGTAQDVIHGHTGTLINHTPASWIGTDVGGALDFDGTSQGRINVPYNEALNLFDGVTVAVRVRPIIGGLRVIVGKPFAVTHTNPFYDWGVLITNAGTLTFRIGSSNTDSTGALSTDTWASVVVTASGKEWNWYIDGQLDKTTANTSLPSNTNSQDVRIGTRADGAEQFKGTLDIVQLFPFAVTAEWVSRWHADPYAAFRVPSIHRRHVAAIVAGGGSRYGGGGLGATVGGPAGGGAGGGDASGLGVGI